MQIQRFKYVSEPFPHLKCENGPECGIGMDCPENGFNKNHTLLLDWHNGKQQPFPFFRSDP